MNRRTIVSTALLLALAAGCTATLPPTHRLGGDQMQARAAAISDDEQWVTTADASGLVRVWSTQTGRELARCEGFVSFPAGYCHQKLTFSHDGSIIAFAGPDAAVRVWWWRTGTGRDLRGLPQAPAYIVFATDDSITATSGGFTMADPTTRPSSMQTATSFASTRQPLTVMTWDVSFGAITNRWENDELGILEAAISSDGRRVGAVAIPGSLRNFGQTSWPGKCREIMALDAASGRTLLRVADAGEFMPIHVVLSPHGEWLYTSGSAGLNGAPGVLRQVESPGTSLLVKPTQAIFSHEGKELTNVLLFRKPFCAGGLNYVGLPIPSPPKPEIRISKLNLSTHRSSVLTFTTTEGNTTILAFAPSGNVFVDDRLNLWLLRHERE
jgi:WD40 repeat protein